MKRALTALALTAGACAAPTPPAPVVTTAPTTSTTTTTVAPTTTSTTHPPRAARRRAAVVAPVAAETAVVASEPVAAVGDVEAAICAAWGAECSRALRVARCESTMNPRARNGQHMGLFQVATDVHAARIARMGFTVEQMLEVGPNIAVAHALWVEQKWVPWTCAA